MPRKAKPVEVCDGGADEPDMSRAAAPLTDDQPGGDDKMPDIKPVIEMGTRNPAPKKKKGPKKNTPEVLEEMISIPRARLAQLDAIMAKLEQADTVKLKKKPSEKVLAHLQNIRPLIGKKGASSRTGSAGAGRGKGGGGGSRRRARNGNRARSAGSVLSRRHIVRCAYNLFTVRLNALWSCRWFGKSSSIKSSNGRASISSQNSHISGVFRMSTMPPTNWFPSSGSKLGFVYSRSKCGVWNVIRSWLGVNNPNSFSISGRAL